MAELEIRLLGDVETFVHGSPVTDFESASTKALLVRLAYDAGRPLRRAAVAEMFWPDRPDGHALANLRHTLAVLRCLLGDRDRHTPCLTITRDAVSLRLGPDVWVDVEEFRRLVATPGTEPGVTDAWESALALRRGPLLADLDPPLGHEWEAWLSASRYETDELAMCALHRVSDLRERAGRYGDALALARVQLDIDAWNEQAHGRVVRLMALRDERAEAVAHAEAYQRNLRAELGVTPGREFLSLVDDLKTGRSTAQRPNAPELPPRPAAAEPCVARETELAWLHRHLDDTQSGTGRVVVLSGTAGSGKTVLLRGFAASARDRMPGLLVLRGTCNAHAGPGDPYLPYRQMLGQLCGDLERQWLRGAVSPAEVDALWAELPATVAALLDVGPCLLGTMVDVPSLAHRLALCFPGHPLVERLGAVLEEAAWRAGDAMRRQPPVLDQYVNVLARLATRHPLLLVVDDLNRADHGTLDLTRHLAERIGDMPVLLVAARRPTARTDAGEADPVTAVVQEVRTRNRADCQLQVTGSRRFVEAWLDTEPNLLDEAFRDDLFRRTAGHALFTVETVAAMRERGDLVRDGCGRWVRGTSLDWTTLPPRVEATIAVRVEPLPADVRRDLEAASVQGDTFVAEVVASARKVPADEVATRLASLTTPAHALIEYTGPGHVGATSVRRFRFRHALVRQYINDSLTGPQRMLLHDRVARALIDLYAERLDDAAAEIARHLDAAGDIGPAIEYHHRAARRAATMAANADAVVHLRRALELLAMPPASARRAEAELALLSLLGACQQAVAGYIAAETTEIYDRLRELLSSAAPSTTSAAALGGLVASDGLRGRYGQAIAGAETLLAMSLDMGDPRSQAMAHLQLGWLLMMTARLAEAEEHLDTAIEMYDPAWEPSLTAVPGLHDLSNALAWRAQLHALAGRPDQARRDSARSIEEARRLGFPFALVFALAVGGCVVFLTLGDGQRTVEFADEAAAIAEREAFASYRAVALYYRGVGLALAGSLGVALPAIEDGLSAWSDLGTEAFVAWFHSVQAEHLVAAGQSSRAAEVVHRVEQRLASGEERVAELSLPLSKAALERARGDDRAAEATLRASMETLERARARWALLRLATALARLLIDHGNHDEASSVLGSALSLVTEGADTRYVREAQEVLGRAGRSTEL